jgi:hypothetical protein
MKRRSFLALAASTPFLLSGCLTSQLIDAANSDEKVYYIETIGSVLISADQAKLVFLGADYHYVFDTPEHFAEILASPLHPLIRANVGSFYTTADENVQGAFVLEVIKPSDLTEEQKQQLTGLGFTGDKWTRRIDLDGMRYSAKKFERSKVSPTFLNQSYQVTVYEPGHSNVKKIALLLTPVTVALDGALMILAIPLVPIGIFLLSDRMGL